MTKNLGIIFGIALSSDGDPSTRVMACHALCACKGLGSFFCLLILLINGGRWFLGS